MLWCSLMTGRRSGGGDWAIGVDVGRMTGTGVCRGWPGEACRHGQARRTAAQAEAGKRSRVCYTWMRAHGARAYPELETGAATHPAPSGLDRGRDSVLERVGQL